MSTQPVTTRPRSTAADATAIPNGPGAAALVAAGIGAFALAVLAIAGDQIAVFGKWMVFYKPTGPLSGVTTSAILIWLATWFALDMRWKRRDVAVGGVTAASLVLLALALLLTFPPIADLF